LGDDITSSEWRCKYQGKQDTKDCYGSSFCCALYTIQKYSKDEVEPEGKKELKDDDGYCCNREECPTCYMKSMCDDYPNPNKVKTNSNCGMDMGGVEV